MNAVLLLFGAAGAVVVSGGIVLSFAAAASKPMPKVDDAVEAEVQRKVCSWCNRDTGSKPARVGEYAGLASHMICPECRLRFLTEFHARRCDHV